MLDRTFTATEFKARCLEIFDQLAAHELMRAVITKRGKAVAVITPPPARAEEIGGLHGLLRGTVEVPAGIDLTAPVLDEPFTAGEGALHR